MSRYERVLRVVGSLLVIALLAAVLSLGLRTVLEVAGVPVARASPIGIAVAITVALAIADVYTPIGRGPRHGDIREKEPAKLATDVVVAAVLTLVVSVALVVLGATVWEALGSVLVVFVVGVGIGYGSFMLRNRVYYFGEQQAEVGE